jgi:hypothetical protein
MSEEVGHGENRRPAEYLRIEVQLDQKALDDARIAIAEVVRNGVFIDGGFSTSSQGIPARRLIFRKLYTPAFPTTFNSRDTFPMTSRHFVEFVRNPASHLRRLLGESGIQPDQQQFVLDGLFEPNV